MSVQLLSVSSSYKDQLFKQKYPQDCKIMQIGKSVTVRCGCFEQLDQAKKRAYQLKKKYNNASIVSTYRYRFSANTAKKSKTLTTKKQETKSTQKLSTCYSITLQSLPKSQKNLDYLYKKSYPKDCKVMEFSKTFGIRCGCFDTFDEAKTRKEKIATLFPNAKISKTYRYRFEPDYYVGRTYEDPHKKISPAEAELRLMLQVFLYKGDLEHAYKVAQLGIKRYPNSYYWNQKMANICQWTNKTAQAIKYLRKMYALHYDPILEDKLIQYGMQYYQYEAIEPLVLNKARKYPTEANIDNLINVYKKIGLPEKVLAVLDREYKRTKNPLLLTKSLELALEIGDLEIAQKYIKKIQKHPPFSKVDAALIAKYYYIKREIDKAYAILQMAKHKEMIEDRNNTKELRYFELTSDIAWYLQKNIPAAKASKKLMDIDKARIVDYERVALVYPNIDNDVAMEAVKMGFKKYKLLYMFYSYANDALSKNKYKELKKLLKEVDEESSPLAKQAMYWIIKSKVYKHFKKYAKEEEALKKALLLAPENTQIKIALLWHFMETGDIKNTKLVLLDIEDSAPLSESLYFPLASAYFFLNNINRASFYLDEMQLNENKMTQTLSYKFLLAYVKQIQNDEPAFKGLMLDIAHTLKKEMKKNPALKKDPKTLSNYLRAAMYISPPDKFEKKLKKAKHYLSKKDYNEIAYSWAVYIKAYEKSHKIYNKTRQKELWMSFSDALLFWHHTNIENMLDIYLALLPQGDAVGALVNDGQIAKAQSTNFELLYNNDKNQNAYIQHIDLSKKRSDLIDIQIVSLSQKPLSQKYIKLSNRSYISNNWYLITHGNIYHNRSTDTNILLNPPQDTYTIDLNAKKEYERGFIDIEVAYNHYMHNYFSTFLDGKYRISDDFTLGGKIGKNIKADTTTQLYLGGKKDSIEPWIKYQILNSTSINFQYKAMHFYSQDDVYLGRGIYFLSNLSYQIRNGYPDISLGIFYDESRYFETEGSRGVIDKLQKESYAVLPNNFYNIGCNISYGMANSQIYTRVWRPFFELASYYNSELGNYTYSIHAGYGGKIFHQDHLSIGGDYSNFLNGRGGKVLKLFINYQFLYTLSKGI